MSLAAALVTVVLLGLNAFFVAAEFALLAARRSQVEGMAAEGDRAARSALAGLKELTLMLAGAQLGITMASFGLGAVAEPAVARGIEPLLTAAGLPQAPAHAVAFVIALSIVVFLHMVVGEMAPKSWAITDPERSVLLLARPFRAFVVVFRPFIRLLNGAANGVVRMVGVTPQSGGALVHSARDLLLLVNQSASQGHVADDEHGMLARALELSGLDAGALMVPRGDVVAAPADADVAALEALASSTGRSRIPVFADDLDHVRGVLHVKDLLRLAPDERAGTRAADLARPALITPVTTRIEDVMLAMRSERQHLAMVVDEHGTVVGLVALEDVLEELIGEFADESDADDDALSEHADGSLAVPGRLRLDELRDHADVALADGDFDTVAGFVIDALGRLPEVGDAVAAPDARDGRDAVTLVVARMDEARVAELALHRDDGRRALRVDVGHDPAERR